MERLLVVASTFCYLFGFTYTIYAFRTGSYRPSRYNFAAVLSGFLFQTAFLAMRGHALKHCPITNLFEVFMFLCWSVGLLYLITGSAYRLSLMGAFTSPLVFILQVFALLALADPDPVLRVRIRPNPWLELHAALSVIAYGAFGVAAVAGTMYLAQERQLKTRQLKKIFFQMPPIADLAVALNRLLLTGFVLLTVGLLAGFVVGAPALKVAWGVGVWLVYGGILGAERLKKVTPRHVAILSIAAFTLALMTLWGLNFITTKRYL